MLFWFTGPEREAAARDPLAGAPVPVATTVPRLAVVLPRVPPRFTPDSAGALLRLLLPVAEPARGFLAAGHPTPDDWYDGAYKGVPGTEQLDVAALPFVKMRPGRIDSAGDTPYRRAPTR